MVHIILIHHCFFLRLSSLYMTFNHSAAFLSNIRTKTDLILLMKETFYNSQKVFNFTALPHHSLWFFFLTTTARTYSTTFVYHKFSSVTTFWKKHPFSVQREVISLIWRSFCRDRFVYWWIYLYIQLAHFIAAYLCLISSFTI